jgi:hypothetical protein
MPMLSEDLIQSWRPARYFPEYRVLPYSSEKQIATRQSIEDLPGDASQHIWHLKRLLWHPTLFESCMNYMAEIGNDSYISLHCNSSYGVLSGYDGNTYEVYDKSTQKRCYYDGVQELLEDGWVLD